jgi:glycogen operon protein
VDRRALGHRRRRLPAGRLPAGWREWNDQYRDTLRSWWLQRQGDRGSFAHRFAASSGQFHHHGRAPTASVNFICAHDGFTLRDLVSFEHKHNLANGEHNRDGHHHNASINCGVEGDTTDPAVLALRHRLQRALLATLLLSQGTPMLLAGDEIGHSQQGNNNAYCQDNATTWLAWPAADAALLACTRRLLALRRRHPALRQACWLTGPSDTGAAATVRWLEPDGSPLCGEAWQADHGALAIWLHAAPTTRPAPPRGGPHAGAHPHQPRPGPLPLHAARRRLAPAVRQRPARRPPRQHRHPGAGAPRLPGAAARAGG